MENLCKFVKFWRPKIVWNASNQNLTVKYDNNDKKHQISIKWQWKKTQTPKIYAWENFWFLENFEKRIKHAARLFDTLEYTPTLSVLYFYSDPTVYLSVNPMFNKFTNDFKTADLYLDFLFVIYSELFLSLQFCYVASTLFYYYYSCLNHHIYLTTKHHPVPC